MHAWAEMAIISVILIEFHLHCVWNKVLQYLQNVKIDSEDLYHVGFNVILLDKFFCEPLFFDVKVETTSSSKIPVSIDQSAWHHTPENLNIHYHCC